MNQDPYGLIQRFDELRFEMGSVVEDMLKLGIIQPDAWVLREWGRARAGLMRVSQNLRQAYMFPIRKRNAPRHPKDDQGA